MTAPSPSPAEKLKPVAQAGARRRVGKLDQYALLAQEIYAVVLLGVVLVVLAGVGKLQ